MRGPRPFRIFLMVILALTPLAQSFWFLQAWRVIDTVAWPGPHALLQGLWIVAALVVLAAALDMLGGRVPSARTYSPFPPPRLPHATCGWLPKRGLARCASHARPAPS
jgi:hypothetical protein